MDFRENSRTKLFQISNYFLYVQSKQSTEGTYKMNLQCKNSHVKLISGCRVQFQFGIILVSHTRYAREFAVNIPLLILKVKSEKQHHPKL